MHQTDEQALAALCAAIPAADSEAARAAQSRLDSLTKPRNSMGQIERLLVRLAASSGHVCPTLDQRAIVLAAADHGVAAEGVSAYPQVVTAQMVLNFLQGGAAINALSTAAGARIVLVDAGVATDLPVMDDYPLLRRLNIRPGGSGNIAREPAMQPDEARAAMLAGARLVEEEHHKGLNLLALGEMGIANTTPAAALTSALTGASPLQTVGRGTGIDDTTLHHKREVVRQALQRVDTTSGGIATLSPFAVLYELGGLEIAVLAGATLAAAARRIPVLLDGYITTSAVLVAAAMAPNVRTHLFASHCSVEPGHRLALNYLGLNDEQNAAPLLNLELRLGEGSGAALAMPLLVSATQMMRDMATFEQASVSKSEDG